jgi:hypothetical protein
MHKVDRPMQVPKRAELNCAPNQAPKGLRGLSTVTRRSSPAKKKTMRNVRRSGRRFPFVPSRTEPAARSPVGRLLSFIVPAAHGGTAAKGAIARCLRLRQAICVMLLHLWSQRTSSGRTAAPIVRHCANEVRRHLLLSQ